MPKQQRPKFAIPLERTIPNRKPGGWMPFVWILFAAILTAGIIFGMRLFFPVIPHPPEIAQQDEGIVVETKISAAARPAASEVFISATEVGAPATEVVTTPPEIVEPLAGLPMVPEAPAASTPDSAVEPAPAEAVPALDGRSATLAQAVALEKRSEGRTTAVIHMKAGERVEIVSHEGGGMVRVRYKEAEGVVNQNALMPGDRN